MKRTLLSLCFSGLFFLNYVVAQSNIDIPGFTIPQPDMTAIAIEDEERNKNGFMYRISVNVPVEHDLYTDGTWDSDQSGNLIYSISLGSVEAKGLNVIFDELLLPEGAEMRLYNPVTGFVVGPYTLEDNIEGGWFYTSFVTGEQAVLEVIIPSDAVGDLKLHIKQVGYFYRNIKPFEGDAARDFGTSGSCQVNAVCTPEGNNFQEEKNGVCRIMVVDGAGAGWCSGSLIGNTSNDCTPYVLTAQHCGSGATASQFRSWQFHFKYESASCSDPATEPVEVSVTGSLRLSSSGTISDVQKSDFLLVLMKNRPSATATPYYNGWNRNNTASTGGKSIHHPDADIKKISTYTGTLISDTWTGTSGTHWRVTWTSTTNGHGVTEGGSSGSPIFNSSGLIVGDLSGGSSFCGAQASSPDLYGKLSYSWNSCGSTPQLKLESWLDRTAVGSTTLVGKDYSTCAAATLPVPDFNASNVYPLVTTEVVTLNDVTTNSPFAWQWTFSGPGTPTYVGGTNQYSQNPQVTFPTVGNYTVVLYAGNNSGYANKSKPAYIHVGNVGMENIDENPITMYPNPVTDMLYINMGNNVWDLEKTTISIMDLAGKYVLVERVVANANIISVSIPNHISTGFYIVQITDGKNTKTEKLEIRK